MTSNINPDFPQQVSATTQSVRDNFGHAKTEIERLQTHLRDIPIQGPPPLDGQTLVFFANPDRLEWRTIEGGGEPGPGPGVVTTAFQTGHWTVNPPSLLANPQQLNARLYVAPAGGATVTRVEVTVTATNAPGAPNNPWVWIGIGVNNPATEPHSWFQLPGSSEFQTIRIDLLGTTVFERAHNVPAGECLVLYAEPHNAVPGVVGSAEITIGTS